VPRGYWPGYVRTMNALLLNRDGFAMPADGWYQVAPLGEFAHAQAGLVQVVDAEACAAMVNRFADEAKGANFAGLLVDFDHFSLDGEKRSESKDGVRSHFLPITFRVTPRQWTLTIFVTLMAMVGERVPPTAEDMANKGRARTRDTTQMGRSTRNFEKGRSVGIGCKTAHHTVTRAEGSNGFVRSASEKR